MKFSVLLAFVGFAVATRYARSEADQQPLDMHAQTYPGFDINLNELRLVQLEGQEPVWMSELEKINLKAQGVHFFDVTETPHLGSSAHLRSAFKPVYPALNHSDVIRPVLKTLSTEGPKENLEKFTSFRTRYYRSDTGRDSQRWLLSRISEITTQYAPKALQDQITINEFPHGWGQNSIVRFFISSLYSCVLTYPHQIVRINGTSATDDSVVIIGAHQDSTNLWPFLPAPGADDDGSGSVTILESYRALIAANFRPVRPVEFHWYSAEEGGLLGSAAIAQAYEARSANVYAMSQFDMTAWVKQGTREEVGVITDFVDTSLTDFNKKLVDEYLDIPWVGTECGYACSDHASWAKAGYPSVFTIESSFPNSNKNIHSTRDRFDISPEFSFSHMLEFSKLAVTFAVELGGWTKDAEPGHMNHHRSEDAQPNEVRSSRKGSSAVPTIRTVPTRQTRRGYRGGAFVPGRHGMNNGAHRDVQGHREVELAGPSNSHSGRTNDWQSNARFQNKRPAPDGLHWSSGRPSKQPRLDQAYSYHPQQNLSMGHRDSRPPSAATRGRTSRRKSGPPLEPILETTIHLPTSCRKGARDCKRQRIDWVQSQIVRVEREEGAKVLGHTFIDDTAVRLQYRKLQQPAAHQVAGHASTSTSHFAQDASVTGDDPGEYRIKDEPSKTPLPHVDVKVEDDEAMPDPLTHRHRSAAISRTSDLDVSTTLRHASSSSEVVSRSMKTEPLETLTSVPQTRDINFQALLEQSRRLDRRRKPAQTTALSGNEVLASGPTVDTKEEDTSSSSRYLDPSLEDMVSTSQPPTSPLTGSSEHIQHPRTTGDDSVQDCTHSIEDHRESISPSASIATRSGPPLNKSQRFEEHELPGIETLYDGDRDDDISSEQSDDELHRSLCSDDSNIDELQEVVRLTKEQHDRPRRILTASDLGVLAVTMRGASHLIGRASPRGHERILAGNDSAVVEDACILSFPEGTLLAMGKTSETDAISLYPLEGHRTGTPRILRRPQYEGRKPGVTALSALSQPRTLVTGGYDHMIHLWRLPPEDDLYAEIKPEHLYIKHASIVQALLSFHDTSQKLISGGADCTVNLWDFASERTVNAFRISNSVFHIHSAISEHCVVLEVAHRELQFELRDLRIAPERAVQRFGYDTSKLHGRHMKGDIQATRFASSSQDGAVRVWDIRKTDSPCSVTSCFPGRRISQVAFDRDELVVVCEDHQVVFLDV
ncbi:Leucine aminopeptidase 1 [Steccherinum ochraceum]|uniref:Peptide hydrolase n=1 Tax=Steccherinum ochraceum TaxID=92696 RepID=A0A4R0RR82_9APHY|nr:Leucine aminopeptidase 1 [Steccherinum ochraceum]